MTQPTNPPPPPHQPGHVPPSAHHHDPEYLHNPEVAHEHTDIDVRTILWSAVVLIAVAVVTHILMYFLFGFLEQQAAANDPPVSPLATPASQMPATTTQSPYFGGGNGPQLLTNEPAALLKQRSTEDETLKGYGWVDQKAGIAHVPIDEAKKLLLERGLPAREGAPVDPRMGTNVQAAGEASGGRAITTGRGAAPAEPGHGTTEHGRGAQPAPPGPPKGHD